jgi:predicted ATP-binding protein involved in virulence
LISSLNSLLQTEPFNQYSYQVVISTHSPLLVSDVPKESIHCFVRDLDTNEVSIKSSRYGFMSNLMDLLTDSFYTDSVFGAYSENYVNQIINEIEALEKEQALDAAKKREKIADLRHRLSVIDDDMIRSSIVRRIQRMEMRIR